MAVIQMTDDRFEEVVLKSELPVMVDFGATWCGPGKYGIMNIPTVLYFKNGEPVDKNVGAAPKKTFVEKLEKLF